MNEDVFGLGETTILDDLFQKIEESNNLSNLAEQYTIKSQELSKNKKITISILSPVEPGLESKEFLNLLQNSMYKVLDKTSNLSSA